MVELTTRIKDLPINPSPNPNQFVPTDLSSTQKLTIKQLVDTGAPIASQAEAETGTNAEKRMTPLTTRQAIINQILNTPIIIQALQSAGITAPSNMTFLVSVGDTSVPIPQGYSAIAYVYLDGIFITDFSAPGGTQITFPAITLEDTGGLPTAEMVIGVGNSNMFSFDTIDGGVV